ncbi:MAG: hypothetical protein AB2A00_13430 [Myxococcota bacterium]
MYRFRIDVNAGCMVGMHEGPTDTDDDYAREVQSLMQLAGTGRKSAPTICVMIYSPETPRPPAHWRQRVADTRAAYEGQQHCFALVTSLVVHRGVLTAMNWQRPPPAGFRVASYTEFDDAAEWADRELGTKVKPVLDRLRTELLRERLVQHA